MRYKNVDTNLGMKHTIKGQINVPTSLNHSALSVKGHELLARKPVILREKTGKDCRGFTL